MGRWDFETFKNLKQNRKNFENAFRQNEKFCSRHKIVSCWGCFLKISYMCKSQITEIIHRISIKAHGKTQVGIITNPRVRKVNKSRKYNFLFLGLPYTLLKLKT